MLVDLNLGQNVKESGDQRDNAKALCGCGGFASKCFSLGQVSAQPVQIRELALILGNDFPAVNKHHIIDRFSHVCNRAWNVILDLGEFCCSCVQISHVRVAALHVRSSHDLLQFRPRRINLPHVNHCQEPCFLSYNGISCIRSCIRTGIARSAYSSDWSFMPCWTRPVAVADRKKIWPPMSLMAVAPSRACATFFWAPGRSPS